MDSQEPKNWFEKLRPFGARWLQYFGTFVLADLSLHFAGPYLGWRLYSQPRSPGEYLFFGAWMAFWFALIREWRARRKRRGVYTDEQWQAMKSKKNSEPTMRDILQRVNQIISQGR